MGQHTIDENKGRRVREKSLNGFLALVEQDEQNLRRMTVSSAVRRATQPELMMSMNCSESEQDLEFDEDYFTKDWRSSSASGLAKDLLSQKQAKKSPAELAACEALCSQILPGDSRQSPSEDSVSTLEHPMKLWRSDTGRKPFCFRSNPRNRTRSVLSSNPSSRRLLRPCAAIPNLGSGFPSATPPHQFRIEELEKKVEKGMNKMIFTL